MDAEQIDSQEYTSKYWISREHDRRLWKRMRADRDMQPWLYEGDGDDLAIPPPGFKSAFPRDWQRNIMNITTPEHWSPYPSPF